MKTLEYTLVGTAFAFMFWLIASILLTFVDISFSWMDVIRRVM